MKNNVPSGKYELKPGEQYKKLLQLVDALPIPVILMDSIGNVIHMNQIAHWLMQDTTGDLTGKKMPACQRDETSLVWRIPTPNGTVQFMFTVIPVTLDGMDYHVLVTDNSGYQRRLDRASEAIFSRMFDQSNDGIVICDSDLIFVEWNRGMEQLTGYKTKEVIGKSLESFLKELLPEVKKPLSNQDILAGYTPEKLEKLIMAGGVIELEQEIKHRNGSVHQVCYRLFPIYVTSRVFLGAVVHDVTEYRKVEANLKASETRFRTLVEAMGEGALILDLDLKILFANPMADSMYGGGSDYLIGRNIRDFVDPEFLPGLQEQVKRVAKGRSARYELDLADFRGNPHTLSITSTPWRGADDAIMGSIIVFRDITEQKIEEERLRFSSTHDELTLLYNRNYYEEEKARLKNSRRYPVSVVMVDMDTLKEVNDSQGHQAGDALLRKFASIARRVFRQEDMIARIGGDEFAVFLPETERETVRQALERLRIAVKKYNDQNPELSLSFSAGTATAPSPDELDEAIHRADYRMFREKKQKKAASSGQS
ncbi:MAG: PAS domain S-box protein [Leptolinea sp.]|nr:PAS domain S-box protein [Leptolinea sp.]